MTQEPPDIDEPLVRELMEHGFNEKQARELIEYATERGLELHTKREPG